jgi:hypothetical protein
VGQIDGVQDPEDEGQTDGNQDIGPSDDKPVEYMCLQYILPLWEGPRDSARER